MASGTAVAEVDFLQGGPGQSPGYNARQVRKFGQEAYGEGVFDRNSFRATFSAGLTFSISAGKAFIRGSNNADQGIYRVNHGTTDAALTVVLDTAHATLPRIDTIVLQVQDSTEDGGANNRPFVTVITGTATAGATLDNRLGAPNLTTLPSPTVIPLFDVLINANNSPALSNSSLRDRRPYAIRGTIPAISTDKDMQILEQAPGLIHHRWKIIGSSHASRQAAALMWLDRRIPATHLRWSYQQDDVAAVGTGQNYIFALADASGTWIAQTAATAFGGATSALRHETVAFNPAPPANFIFEAGAYYLFFGITALPSTAAFHCHCVINDVSGSQNGYTPPAPNMFFRNGSGGVTLPANIFGLQEVWGAETAGGPDLPVPIVTLSVG